MVKIKDNIDLKELEKFGFIYKENKRFPRNSIWNWNDMLEVKENKEQIYIRTFNKREITVYSTCGIAIDKLYDLIQEGLVEKMEKIRCKKNVVNVIVQNYL